MCSHGSVSVWGVSIEARIGIETGPVIIGGGSDLDNAAIGETPNLAARLQGIATPGMIVIGEKTKVLLADNAQLSSIGSHQLKGFSDSVDAWQVNGLGFGLDHVEQREAFNKSTFVGRERELQAVESSLAQVRAGENACVHIVGEPGIGKSRLIHEFLTRAPRTTRVLTGHCAPFGTATLHPFATILAKRAKTRAELTGSSPKDALGKELTEIDSNLASDIPYLLRLAGISGDDDPLDPDTIGMRTQKALVRVIGAIGRIMPTILFINDIHWIDERSEIVLNELADTKLRGVLIICTFRSEYSPGFCRWVVGLFAKFQEFARCCPRIRQTAIMAGICPYCIVTKCSKQSVAELGTDYKQPGNEVFILFTILWQSNNRIQPSATR